MMPHKISRVAAMLLLGITVLGVTPDTSPMPRQNQQTAFLLFTMGFCSQFNSVSCRVRGPAI